MVGNRDSQETIFVSVLQPYQIAWQRLIQIVQGQFTTRNNHLFPFNSQNH